MNQLRHPKVGVFSAPDFLHLALRYTAPSAVLKSLSAKACSTCARDPCSACQLQPSFPASLDFKASAESRKVFDRRSTILQAPCTAWNCQRCEALKIFTAQVSVQQDEPLLHALQNMKAAGPTARSGGRRGVGISVRLAAMRACPLRPVLRPRPRHGQTSLYLSELLFKDSCVDSIRGCCARVE